MTAFEFYRPIYRSLFDCTPLKKDCGILCGEACCKDGEEPAGMFLFPGEEQLYRGQKEMRIEPSNCEFGEDQRAKILFCQGKCDRRIRPLACRIFPLIPYRKPGKALQIIMDPRADALCPLSRNLTVEQLEPVFVERVKKACCRILKLKDGEDYIAMLSEIVDQMLECRTIFRDKES